jgi:hypothetical protein
MSKELQTTGASQTSTYQTGGVIDVVDELAKAIKALEAKHNVINPGGAIGAEFPMLYSVGISFVFIDPKNETYGIRGGSKLAIGKTALDRIAAAAGVRWDPALCGRVDEGSSPFLVEYQCAARVLQLDGTERLISASKRIDLRAEAGTDVSTWGADAQEIAKDAAAATPPRQPWPQILQARQHILSNAETKAKNRAIRTLGVRSSYEPAEIAKGFAVVKLHFTGHSDDPEVERAIQMMIAGRALGAQSNLYGPREGRPALQAARVVPRLAPTAEPDPACETKAAPATPPAAAPKENAAAPAEQDQQMGGEYIEPVKPSDDPLLICGKKDPETGKCPKKPCSAFTADHLRSNIAYAEKMQYSWDPRWAAKNLSELKAMKAWLAYKEFDPSQMQFPETADGPEPNCEVQF